MGKFDERASLLLVFCVLAVHIPAEAWYKQAVGPNYYSVGRASGLLSGIRRSAFRRDEPDTRDSENNPILQLTNSHSFALKNMVSPRCILGLIHLTRFYKEIRTSRIINPFLSSEWSFLFLHNKQAVIMNKLHAKQLFLLHALYKQETLHTRFKA